MINRRSLLALFATAPIAAKVAPAPAIAAPPLNISHLSALSANIGTVGMTGRISDASGSLVIDFANGAKMVLTENELYDDLSYVQVGHQYDLFTEH